MNNDKRTIVTDEDLVFFYRNGYLVLKNILSESDINKLKDEFEAQWVNALTNKSIIQNKDQPISSLFPKIFHVHKNSSLISNLMTNGPLYKVMKKIIKEEVLLASSTAFYKAPGAESMQPHQDEYGFGAGVNSGAIWVGLEDINNQNGGLYFIPGSHKLGLVNLPNRTIYEENIPSYFSRVDINISAGDAVIINPFVIHGSNQNSSMYNFRKVLFGFFCGESVEEIFENNEELMNTNGEYVKRRSNIKHLKKRVKIDKQPFWGE